MAIEFMDNAAQFAKRRAEQATTVLEKKKVCPRHQWVLIRKVEPKDIMHTESGVLETRSQARSQVGEVMAFSRKITDLKLGDLVLFTNFPMALEDIEELTGDRNLHLVMDEEVYAILE